MPHTLIMIKGSWSWIRITFSAIFLDCIGICHNVDKVQSFRQYYRK